MCCNTLSLFVSYTLLSASKDREVNYYSPSNKESKLCINIHDIKAAGSTLIELLFVVNEFDLRKV